MNEKLDPPMAGPAFARLFGGQKNSAGHPKMARTTWH